ncbi:MAG: hypothetical protein D6709_07225 [Chloroflexi bacterium]|jgi:hypothetical protein|uniref:Uncharacterized protein n=1 Tax=Candidatus Thermofonsia Clade 3 bacterium TaxID=2364212 RepID=A0A2M8QCT1_9CHLR|nr:hypothetical protein [Candidatus Roseilinea sp. NK_OTU-006]PJF47613.1 MAG: hypothetical protein CUN48_07785 [Candidatus Thermofonsia Clade 3 bacterium]RMG63868.1 MAG: hypothetical protein D6709_07225 [Chloroflexota bacterium]
MTVGEMLKLMRDPLGAPFYPPALQVLLVVTWVLHIFFVTTALGTSALSIFAFTAKKGAGLWLQAGRLAARLTPNALGLGIVTGIAPLLFVQTIYDPLWYAANTLTGFWSALFIFVVMGGYSLAYVFYLKGSRDGRLLFTAILSLILLFLAGWVMHVLHAVSIRPEQWKQWYMPSGVIDTRGVTFHAYNIPRLVFLLPLQAVLSLAVVMMFASWYLRKRGDDTSFLHWLAALGRTMALVVSPLYGLTGLAWAVTEGPEFGATTLIAVPLVAIGIALTIYFLRLKQPAIRAPLSLGVWLLAVFGVAIVREAVRVASLARYGYTLADYPYHFDWGSILVFGVTTIVGVMVVLYLILVLYQANASQEGTVSLRVERLGKVATGMLGAWFGFFVLMGLYSTFVLR